MRIYLINAALQRLISVGLVFLASGWISAATASELSKCIANAPQASTLNEPLPQRSGTQVQTSGRVPHIQLDVELNPELIRKLHQLAFSLPGIEERPTIVSLPGGKGMWLTNKLPVVKPKAIVSGREFAHIHTDGSLHAPLPFERALELEQKGWGERHPWADRRDGWEGFVMLYSAENNEQLTVLIQLVTESYNFVTGQAASIPGC